MGEISGYRIFILTFHLLSSVHITNQYKGVVLCSKRMKNLGGV